jgi:hypothetical protein
MSTFSISDSSTGATYVIPAKAVAYIEHNTKTNELRVFMCFGHKQFKTPKDPAICTASALASALEWVVAPRGEIRISDVKIIYFLRHVYCMAMRPLVPADISRVVSDRLPNEETQQVIITMCTSPEPITPAARSVADDGTIPCYKTYLDQGGASCWD